MSESGVSDAAVGGGFSVPTKISLNSQIIKPTKIHCLKKPLSRLNNLTLQNNKVDF